MTRVPEPPREDLPELPRYDEPLYRQETTREPRYRPWSTTLEGTVRSCSVCAALIGGPEGQRQHTEFHRLLGGALEALAERPAYGVRRL